MDEEDCKYLPFYIILKCRFQHPRDLNWRVVLGEYFLDLKLFTSGALVRNETVVPCERCSQYGSSSRGTLTTNL